MLHFQRDGYSFTPLLLNNWYCVNKYKCNYYEKYKQKYKHMWIHEKYKTNTNKMRQPNKNTTYFMFKHVSLKAANKSVYQLIQIQIQIKYKHKLILVALYSSRWMRFHLKLLTMAIVYQVNPSFTPAGKDTNINAEKSKSNVENTNINAQ